jgi:hypothetical protein
MNKGKTPKQERAEKEKKELFRMRIFAGFIIVLAISALYVCNKAREPKEIVYKVFKEI